MQSPTSHTHHHAPRRPPDGYDRTLLSLFFTPACGLVPIGQITPPSSSPSGSLQTKHLPFSLNHLLAHTSCATCVQFGRTTPKSLSLNCDRQIGHFVTRTPSNESLSFVLPAAFCLRESTCTNPGRRVAIAAGEAAGFLAGPRNEVI